MLSRAMGTITKLSPDFASMNFGQKANTVKRLIAEHGGDSSCIMFGKTY